MLSYRYWTYYNERSGVFISNSIGAFARVSNSSISYWLHIWIGDEDTSFYSLSFLLMHPDDPTMFNEDDIIWDTDTWFLDDDSDLFDNE